MKIELHPKLGLNPHRTYCPRCKGDAREIAMVGARNHKRTCASCGCVNYGARPGDKCGKCRQALYDSKKEEIGEYERLPGELCEACEVEVNQHAEIVAAGGVYWKCAAGHSGVIKADSPYAAAVRKAHGLPAPAPCGVELESEYCPRCKGEVEC